MYYLFRLGMARKRHADNGDFFVKDPVESLMQRVHAQPDHLAVVQDECSITYKEFGSLAARIAATFAMHCTNPRVLIYLPKGFQAYAAMFGTLMAGGYYSPINMETPLHRHIAIFNQFEPNIVISSQKVSDLLPVDDPNVLRVNVEELSAETLNKPLPAHNLAYVMFTSGSTGTPKGVMIPRSALAHYTDWAIEAMAVRPADRWSQHPNIAFDLSVLDIYGALCGGATLFPIISKRDKLLPADFIRRHGLTIWNSVPSVVDLMSRARQTTKDYFASLRLMTFCGEPLYERHLQDIFKANNQVLVHNTYGPTEATVSCTLLKLTAETYKQVCKTNVALGHPIPGTEILLHGGCETEGELIILGKQLAAGYWRNPEETEKVFQKIFLQGEEKPAYRTGDWIAKKEGDYYFISRKDFQVKVHGNRVELDEIDATIFKLGYGQSCTICLENELHSFIETQNTLDIAVLKKELGTYLPDYEVPRYVHMIDSFPLNANHKIDRRQLAEMIDSNTFDRM